MKLDRLLYTIFLIVFSGVAAWGVSQLPELQVDNLNINGNTITSTNTNGDITLTPNGTGDVILSPLSNGNRALESGAGGEVTESAVTSTELGYVSGVTSALQTQLDAKIDDFSSTTDNALVRTDGTSGNAVQDSGVIVDDSDNITGVASLNAVTSTELSQLENIDATTISATQWGYLGVLDQNLRTTDTPTFDGVTLTNPMTLSHETTPSNPSAGNVKLYPKNDDKLYLLNSAGTETEIGSGGGGAGGINYILNSDYETNADDWNTYDDAAAAPVDGTGGTVDYVSVARTTTASEILRGDASLKISKTANNAQGEGFSYDFAIHARDRERDLIVSFDYKMLDANYASSDVIIYVYDIDKPTLIGKVRNDQNGELYYHGGDGTTFKAVFSATDSLNYRLIFHVASTNATAYDFVIDNVSVGPDKSVPVNIIQKINYNFPTPTTTDGTEMVNVDNISIHGDRRGGVYSFGINFGFDVSSATSNDFDTALWDIVSDVSELSGKTITKIDGSFGTNINGSTDGRFYVFGYFGLSSNKVAINFAGDFPGAQANRYASGTLNIYVEDDDSTSQVSTTENTFKNVDVRGAGNGGGLVTANVTDVDFTETSDPLGAWNGSQFTAPATGRYDIEGAIYNTSGTQLIIYGYIDGVQDQTIGITPSAYPYHKFSSKVYLEKGQVWSVRVHNSITLSNVAVRHWISISSIQDTSVFSVTGETELVESSSSGVSYPIAADTWGDLTSITLGPGEWDLTGQYVFTNTGATTYPGVQLAITSTSGNSTTGMVTGDNRLLDKGHNVSGEGHAHFIEDRGIVLNNTTTYYLKSRVATSVTNLSVAYKISARRIK